MAQHHKLKVPISRIREIAGTDRVGTNAAGMVKAAEQLGFYAKAVKGDATAFASDFTLPAVALTITKKGMAHFVVIHKKTENSVVVADPGAGLVTVSLKEFLSCWLGVLILLTPSTDFRKDNQTENFLLSFFRLLIPQKRLLIFIFLASVLITVFGILGAFYFRIIMDTIVPGALRTTLTTVSIGLIVLYAIKAFTEFFRSHLTLYLSQRLDIPLLLGYYQHVIGLPMSFFGTRRVGEVISRFMDATKIRDAISGAALTVMIDALMAIIGGIILYLQNSSLFFVALIMVLSAEQLTAQRVSQVEASLMRVQSDLDTCQLQIIDLNSQVESGSIAANASGTIMVEESITPGAIIQPGTTLFHIVPTDEEYKVILLVQDKDIASVQAGGAVLLSISAFPYQEYGRLIGTISYISATSLAVEGIGQVYRVEATLPESLLVNRSGVREMIGAGMTVRADIVSGTESWMTWLLKEINLRD
ncbi:MAG: cysteine peptidase family C39 domain-containing protein [Coriobacteriia bacterium]|nr:cysteine peptidase family C39 domain-containing protein [Coriobacteriia bacterium]